MTGRLEIAAGIEAHEHGGELEQRVRRAVEAARFDVHDHGQKAAKARGNRRQRCVCGQALPLRRGSCVEPLARAPQAPAVVRVRSSTVSRTPKPVMSVGTWARPPLCCPALMSTWTHGIAFGTKRARKRAPENVVAGRLDAALLDVGDVALQQLVVVVVHREWPHALAARSPGLLQQRVGGGAIREDAGIAFGERRHAAPRQSRIVDDETPGFRARRVRACRRASCAPRRPCE